MLLSEIHGSLTCDPFSGFSDLAWVVIPGACGERVFLPSNHRVYSDSFGNSHGVIYGDFSSHGDFYWQCNFHGESPSPWRNWQPSNYTYEELSLELYTYHSEDEEEIHAVLEPETMTLIRSGSRLPLTVETLQELLTGTSDLGPQGVIPEATIELYSMLQAAGAGTLPRPRHHRRFYEGERGQWSGSVAHYRVGWAVPHHVVLVMAIWCLLGLTVIIVHNPNRAQDKFWSCVGR